MAINLTIKGIPDEIYRRLKSSAEANRRSLNSEAIVRLESIFFPDRVDLEERLSRARSLRANLPKVKASDINLFKREGRR